MSRVQKITIAEDDEDQRLDRWLKKQFSQLKQSHIEKMCRKGDLRIDGRRAKPSTRIELGQIVRIPPIIEKPESQYSVIEKIISNENHVHHFQRYFKNKKYKPKIISEKPGLGSGGSLIRNIKFLENVINHPQFQNGEVNVNFIDENPDLFEFRKGRDRGTKSIKFLGDIIVNGNADVKRIDTAKQFPEQVIPSIVIKSIFFSF